MMAVDDGGRCRVVVGVDGSAGSLAALRWAAREARLRRGVLHVVQAWEPPSVGVASYARQPRRSDTEARDVARAALHATVRTVLCVVDAVEVVVRLVEGRPEQILPRLAADADLLVLGSHARRESPPSPVGPTLRACLRRSPCAVVMVAVPQAWHPAPHSAQGAHPAAALG